MTTMPCFSIRQPWPWAIFVLGKDVENRSWSTRYRGPILIHAGKHFYPEEIREDVVDCAMMARKAGARIPDKVTLHELKEQTGGIVGMTTIVGCVRDNASPWAIPANGIGCWPDRGRCLSGPARGGWGYLMSSIRIPWRRHADCPRTAQPSDALRLFR